MTETLKETTERLSRVWQGEHFAQMNDAIEMLQNAGVVITTQRHHDGHAISSGPCMTRLQFMTATSNGEIYVDLPQRREPVTEWIAAYQAAL